VERPILHVELGPGGRARLHVVNVHLKAKIPTDIPGQQIDNYTWRSAEGWAEGVFISSMKRMSQALEVRRLVDRILDREPQARIVVAGDFNATPEDVPVLAIRGAVEDTGNGELAGRVLVPIQNTVPEQACRIRGVSRRRRRRPIRRGASRRGSPSVSGTGTAPAPTRPSRPRRTAAGRW